MKIVLETACGCTQEIYNSRAMFEPPRSIFLPLRIQVTVTQSLVSDSVYSPIREFRIDRREGETWFYREWFSRP